MPDELHHQRDDLFFGSRRWFLEFVIHGLLPCFPFIYRLRLFGRASRLAIRRRRSAVAMVPTATVNDLWRSVTANSQYRGPMISEISNRKIDPHQSYQSGLMQSMQWRYGLFLLPDCLWLAPLRGERWQKTE
jgi:hypothetical protein